MLCVDEKSQIQALDRTQPGLPLKKGRCGTWTHDYVRHGTTTLFAALNAASGKVSGELRKTVATVTGACQMLDTIASILPAIGPAEWQIA